MAFTISTSKNRLNNLFSLANGEMRGKVKIKEKSSLLRIDPSGLYLSVILNQNAVIYELATGNLIYEFKPDFSEI